VEKIMQDVSVLIAKNLRKKFSNGSKSTLVLDDINVSFNSGKTYAIKGVSGSGKTTLLHVLGGFEFPSMGNVFWGDKDVFSLEDSEKLQLTNSFIGFVFQFHYLLNEFNAIENIIMPGLIKGLSRKECLDRAYEVLDAVGLSDKAKNYPSQLSGGEQQRMSILRAVFNSPVFLLADEPTGDLDSDNAKKIVDFLLKCVEKWGMGLIICTHDEHVCSKMDQVLKLRNGVLY
jgi:lipoprotein-releasing system ATP-binding protein